MSGRWSKCDFCPAPAMGRAFIAGRWASTCSAHCDGEHNLHTAGWTDAQADEACNRLAPGSLPKEAPGPLTTDALLAELRALRELGVTEMYREGQYRVVFGPRPAPVDTTLPRALPGALPTADNDEHYLFAQEDEPTVRVDG